MRGRRWLVVAAAVAVLVVPAVAATLLAPSGDRGGKTAVVAGSGGGDGSAADEPTPTTVVGPSTDPGDGTNPARLPLTVDPAAELVDGTTVTVSGSGFTPGIQVGIVQCAREARGGGGVALCDTSVLKTATASGEGRFSTSILIRRFISTSRTGEIDCGDPVDRCAVAAGNLQNYDEAGAAGLTFSTAPPPPGPELAVTPDGPYRDAQTVSVRGIRFPAGESVQLMECPGEVRAGTAEGCFGSSVDPPIAGETGTFSSTFRLRRVLQFPGRPPHDCATAPCTLRARAGTGRSAAFALTFDRRLPLSEATAEIETSYPMADGQRVTVVGRNFRPDERVRVVQCSIQLPCPTPAPASSDVVTGTADERGRFSVRLTYRRSLGRSDGERLRCDGPEGEPFCFFRIERVDAWELDVPIRPSGAEPGR